MNYNERIYQENSNILDGAYRFFNKIKDLKEKEHIYGKELRDLTIDDFHHLKDCYKNQADFNCELTIGRWISQIESWHK